MATGVKSSSIKDIGNLCTGCGSCQAICPKNAIRLRMNSEEGFYQPIIDTNICNECGLCLKVCPGAAVNFHDLEQSIFGELRSDQLLGVFNKCYAGHSLDPELRFAASSGGIVTELLRTALSLRLVDGVTTSRMKIHTNGTLEPLPFMARKPEDLMIGIGSKYAPVPMNICIEEILKKDGRFGVVGLPCHIHGVRKMQELFPELRKKISFCIGLFCAKNIRLTGTNYLLKKLNVSAMGIRSLSYRGQGWPGGMRLLCNDGSSFFVPVKDYYKSDFDAFTVPRCSLCSDQTNELADVSCGDAWHIIKGDAQGSSVVIVRNKIGWDLITEALNASKIEIAEIDGREVIKSQGGFEYKKRDIVGRMAFYRTRGKKTPNFVGIELSMASKSTNLRALSVYSKMWLSSRKELWPLLNLYCKGTDLIAGIMKS